MLNISASYDYAIIGGGIAGLASAELLARSGRQVVLIEGNETLCREASASQHGWFHFGSLYSIFPQNQFLRTMVGGVEDMLRYYAGFPGMNIKLTKAGKLVFPQFDEAWFRDEPIEYIVAARNDPDFDMRRFDGAGDYARKMFFLATWEFAIKQFISRHQRFHKHDWSGDVAASQWIPRAGWMDYSRKVITKPDRSDINLDRDTHFRIVGYDRPMRATAIITDLVRSLIGSGGDIMTQSRVDHIEQLAGARLIHTTCGKTIKARTVVLAAGKWLGRFLKATDDVKIVASPLLVAYPAVVDRNFVRMTPFVEKSVNHLHHEINGQAYSLIGGGYFADPGDEQAVARATDKLKDMALQVFPKLADAQMLDSYLGYKTEISAKSGERNYQYIVREVDDGIYAVVPGKFSLGFSLAVRLLKALTGEEAQALGNLAPLESAQAYVGLTKHASLVQRYNEQKNQ